MATFSSKYIYNQITSKLQLTFFNVFCQDPNKHVPIRPALFMLTPKGMKYLMNYNTLVLTAKTNGDILRSSNSTDIRITPREWFLSLVKFWEVDVWKVYFIGTARSIIVYCLFYTWLTPSHGRISSSPLRLCVQQMLCMYVCDSQQWLPWWLLLLVLDKWRGNIASWNMLEDRLTFALQ